MLCINLQRVRHITGDRVEFRVQYRYANVGTAGQGELWADTSEEVEGITKGLEAAFGKASVVWMPDHHAKNVEVSE